jgi:hypothetical protein
MVGEWMVREGVVGEGMVGEARLGALSVSGSRNGYYPGRTLGRAT